ncbi:hypothetical protein GOODEAATRI_034130 [Goodea atripinnis]|uniref:Uncharacterized protein n=1 Tax=Goodea atripinnis TaxID=208336 RepID=A0ABV0NIF1_9TELE
MQSQTARDHQSEKEAERQEMRWKSLQHQFRQLQAHVEDLKEERQYDGDRVGEDPYTHDSDGDGCDDKEEISVMWVKGVELWVRLGDFPLLSLFL